MRIDSLLFCTMLALSICHAGEEYKYGPDSAEQENVPKGVVTEYKMTDSKAYPSTSRTYWIYLPPNFNKDTEYAFMIFFDGGGCIGPKSSFRVPTVFDNLIHKKEIPPMVGLFVTPGTVPPLARGASGRSTRSFEYDTPDDLCSRFVINELMPLVAKHAKLSPKAEDHGAMGISSSGIAAFNLAWQRPDVFGKVISYIGSFTNIRGGFGFPSAIRKTERKPIRVFLQEGSNDLDNVHGNWPLSNQGLANALKFAGYDYKFVMGTGGHSGQQGSTILPDALRWLWREDKTLPKPTPEVPNDMALSGIIIPSEEWQLVAERKKQIAATCGDADGNFYFYEKGGEGVYKIAVDGTTTVYNSKINDCADMKMGPDGKLFVSLVAKHQVRMYDANGKEDVLADGVSAGQLVVMHTGTVFFTEIEKNKVMSCTSQGQLSTVAEQLYPFGIGLSPNRETLAVSDSVGNAIWAFRIEENGTLGAKMPIMPYTHFGRTSEPEGGAMLCDTRSRYYCSTLTGIETYDPNGRPIGVMLPPGNTPISNIVLAGPDLSWIYGVANGSIYKRKINAKGFATYLAPAPGEEKKK